MFENPMLAIDIGSYSVKIVEIAGTTDKQLTRVGVKVLPAGAIVNGIIQDKVAVCECIISLLKELGVRKFLRRAALAISGSAVIVKHSKIIPSDDRDIAEQVFALAEEQFQTDMNELYFDYHLSSPENAFEQFAVMIGTRRETIRERVEIIRKSGLLIGCIDCDLFALSNIVEQNFGAIPGIIAIMNMGAHTSQVVFTADGEYLYSREIAVGGDFYTKGLADLLGMTMENAEELKLNISRSLTQMTPEVDAAFKTMHNQIISEFQMSVELFLQSGEAPIGQNAVRGLFLAGGGSLICGLTEALGEKLEIPARHLNPFETIATSKKIRSNEDFRLYGSAFGVAAGLGLRRFGDVND